MIKQRMNIPNLAAAMTQAGLSQAGVASRLKVTREAVSQWLSEKSFPRPDKLLQLSKLLGLSFQEMVLIEEEHAPVVAFRKFRGTKLSAQDHDHARAMGRMLRLLAPKLPFDLAVMPPQLKEPKTDFLYVAQAAQRVRREINLEPGAHLDVAHLVRHFKSLQAVLIPVLWGNERGSGRHANAAHIYLPDSGTTWVYLNLDTNLLDFKFWMAHELGHCLAPGEKPELEVFADSFAGALLFPQEDTERMYAEIRGQTPAQQFAVVLAAAIDRRIAPFTICKQLEAYAEFAGLPKIAFGDRVHKVTAGLNKRFPIMSHHILGVHDEVSTSDYIERSTQFFDTPFFEVLGSYLRTAEQGPGFVETVMDIPLLDARSLYDELT